MKTLYGNNISKTLQNLFFKVKDRLYISSPYIGGEATIRRILTDKWLLKNTIDFKILIDYSNLNNCNSDTLNFFIDMGAKIKSLKGLHAKIYIIDNYCIFTSANFTNTAFTKRYEVGLLIDLQKNPKLLEIFQKLWKNIDCYTISEKDIKPFTKKTKKTPDDESGNNLKKLWDLPDDKNKLEINKHVITKTLFDIYLQKQIIKQNANIWKISLGGRKGDEYIYNDCKKTNTIAIGWLPYNNLSNWGYNRIFNNLVRERKIFEYSTRKKKMKPKQDASTVDCFVNKMKIGDIILVYEGRYQIRDIGIIESEYYHDNTKIIYRKLFSQRRKVIWIASSITINIRRINNGKSLSEKTIYLLKRINVNDIRDLIFKNQ